MLLRAEEYFAPCVSCFYLIYQKLLAPADSALVVVLSDADGVDELFFGAQGIVKGMYRVCAIVLPASLSISCTCFCTSYIYT